MRDEAVWGGGEGGGGGGGGLGCMVHSTIPSTKVKDRPTQFGG